MSLNGRGVAALTALLVACQPATAQTEAWERVKLIEPGRKVFVTRLDGSSVNGRMHAWSLESIAVTRRGNRQVEVPRTEVARVAMSAGMSRGVRAAWAGGIGAAAGAGVFAALCAGDANCDIAPSAIAAGAALLIGGISAGIAALIPQHKETIYSAKPAAARKP